MEKYASVLQLCAIIFIIFLCYFLFKYVIYLIKKNRLVDFSLRVKTNRHNPILKMVKSVSKILKKIPFIKTKKYNNYARLIKGFDDGYDILASKVLCSLFSLFLYLFVSLLYRAHIYIVVVLVTLILGYVILDFYYIFNGRNSYRIVNKDLLGAIIIMSNDFKANRSVEQAINDVIERKEGLIGKEFKKVLDDTEIGLSYGEAFLRMYKRTGIKSVLDISHAFTLYNMIGSDLIDIFSDIEIRIIEEEKFDLQIKSYKTFNNFFRFVFLILPIFLVIVVFSMNNNYLKLITTSRGVLLIGILVVIFIIYVVLINKVVRRYSYDNK